MPHRQRRDHEIKKMGDKYKVNDATIVKPDMMGTNGGAQGIDAVMPPQFAPPRNLK